MQYNLLGVDGANDIVDNVYGGAANNNNDGDDGNVGGDDDGSGAMRMTSKPTVQVSLLALLTYRALINIALLIQF